MKNRYIILSVLIISFLSSFSKNISPFKTDPSTKGVLRCVVTKANSQIPIVEAIISTNPPNEIIYTDS